MSVYEDIRTNRRWIWFGIWVGYSVALAALVVRLINTDPLTIGEILGSVALAAATAIPPTLAWISLDRRPGLLPVAALSALMAGLVSFLVLPVGLLVALIFMRAWSTRHRAVEVSRPLWWAGVGLGFGVVLAVFGLFIHLDPVCSETYADGSVVSADPSDHGFRSGWRLGAPAFGGIVSSETSQSGADGPVSSGCSSDTVVWWEGLLSLTISGGVFWAATRWPVNAPAVPERVTRSPNVGS